MEGEGAESRRPLGRGGRGDAMRRAMEMYKRRPGASLEDNGVEQTTAHVPDHPVTQNMGPGGDGPPPAAPAPALSAGAGRAQRLQKLLEKHSREKAMLGGQAPAPAPAPATPVPAPVTAAAAPAPAAAAQTLSPPAAASGGRGRALAMLLEKHKQKSGGGRGDSDADRLASRFQRMAVDLDKPPVIRKGTAGRPADLYTNHIGLAMQPGRAVHEYELRFTPYQDSMGLRFKLLRHEKVKAVIGKASVHDGGKYYLPVRLPQEITKIDVPHPNPGAGSVLVEFIWKKEQPIEACIHLLNICMKRIMGRLKLTEMRRSYFDSEAAVQIQKYRMEVWPGYITAIHCFEGGIKLNVDVAHRVLHTSTAMDCIQDAFNTHRDRWLDAAIKTLVGSVVMTRYNKRTYRVDDIDYKRTPKDSFQLADGSKTTFIEYYKKNYLVDIKNPDQPLLISRPKKRENESEQYDLCLIPELCHMTGLTDAQRSDFRMMKDLMAQTAVKPEDRVRHLATFIRRIKGCPEANEVLLEWGLSLDDSVSRLDGRQLEPERLRVGGGREIQPDTRDYSWDRAIKSNKALTAVDLRSWVVVYLNRNENVARQLVNALLQACQGVGMNAAQPQMISLQNERTETFVEALRRAIGPQLQLALAVMPSQRDDRYAAIKRLCYVEMPVASQVVNFRTINKEFGKLRPIAFKIAMQINCKLGGELWSCRMPVGSTMLCGVDVYHDSPRHKDNSVLAFVSALNPDQTRYHSQARVQKQGQELGDTLSTCLLTAVRQWHRANNALPEHIVIFRDGVGEGQLAATEMHEIKQYESVFTAFGDEYKPKLNVVIVQKRINTRIFSAQGRSIANPGPGTIVDHSVTARHHFDFYLVSQHVNQGTVSPTHYIVLRDGGQWPPDALQKISYKACHLYYNWCGTVRVPAPVQTN
ncbi:Piwi-like protein Ago3 [Amphibalanus amphitrite]|uniref:Piwi-like protein Ago3 n=1 Tax=Amphibalanus amphitrite TaxID=1232801 RepID=A0A6A4WFC9_AMPAM|nr:Piwi-like protein Ago3 [Amphibalanus amphitrite]